ncbi:MAG: DNA double-strand break repair nuclease NurA [Cyanobacteria bacterium P01_H01_bin.119]
MPIKPFEIRQQLMAKVDQFQTFNRDTLDRLKRYRDALKTCANSSDLLQMRLGQLPSQCGAMPLEPLAKTQNGTLPFGLVWHSREGSLEWVRSQLSGITTFAVDGSQIFPSKDISLLVALVQVGWYENPHTEAGRYTKDIEMEIMTPTDWADDRDGRDLLDRRVNMKRFAMETDRLVRYLESRSGCDRTLVFFDGSLVATFAEAFDAESQRFYRDCLIRLVEASDRCRVPLVGYVDTSRARDLVSFLQAIDPQLPEAPELHDALILNTLMGGWGDRTPLYRCCRSGILQQYGDLQDQVTFTYLRTNQGHPARLELPLWIYQSGRLEQVLNWVRAEVVVGGGYPYAIETADQTAVLQTQDRQLFLKILQDWAEQNQLNLRFSRKLISKIRRR